MKSCRIAQRRTNRAICLYGAAILAFFFVSCATNAKEPEIKKVSKYFSGELTGTTFSTKHFHYSWEYQPYDGRIIKNWIGGDSSKPEYVVNNLEIEIDGIQIQLPKASYFDLFDPQVQGREPYILEDSKFIYLVILLSDGAGSAKVMLRFANGRYVGRDISERQ